MVKSHLNTSSVIRPPATATIAANAWLKIKLMSSGGRLGPISENYLAPIITQEY